MRWKKLTLALLAAGALAGCDPGSARVQVRLGGTPVALPSEIALPPLPSEIALPQVRGLPQPEATPVPPSSAPAAGQPAMPEGLPSARVVEVVDGDTLDVELDGQRARLRLIGMNTPETVDPRQPVECFGKEASERAKQLLSGQTVQLEADPSQGERDKYDRLLRYVWLPGGRLFNLEMIAQGYAFEYTYETPYKYQAAFQQAQQHAREAQAGLWAPNTCNGEQKPAS
jgi:micrococcal nuclease